MEVLPKCINRNRAVSVCISDECGHPNPFICANCVNNQCKQLHVDCIIADWTNIKRRMEKVKQPNHPDFVKLSSAVEQTIKKSIKYLEKQLQYFNVWRSTFGMPTEAVNLFKSIQNNQEHKFSGKQVAQILKDAKTEKEIKKYNEANIKQQIKEVLKEMEHTQKMIREMYSVWDVLQVNVEKVPQLSLKIKQYYLDNMNKRLANMTEKPTEIELKCNKIDISGVIMNQLIRVHFNIISGSTFQYHFSRNYELMDQCTFQYHFRGNYQLMDQCTFQYHFRRNYQLMDQCTFQYHFRGYISISFQTQSLINGLGYISISFQPSNNVIMVSIYLVAQSLKNPNLKSLKTLILYMPYSLGFYSDVINCEQQISSSLLSLPDLQSVTIIADDIKSLDGFKSLGSKLKSSKDQGWHKRQEWQKQ